MLLELPGSPLAINSPFYIERYPVEKLAYQEIIKQGSLLRIKAPNTMGKTSLMLRLINYGKAQNYATVVINFKQAKRETFNSLDQFLRWFCANISNQLDLPLKIDDYWDENFGSKISATLYVQGYILEQIDQPILLCLNQVHTIFKYPTIAQDFLTLLRSWHEEGKQLEDWLKLHLVVIHSTEIYIPLNINQSPFNVGTFLNIPPFNLEQIQKLALKYGFLWAKEENYQEQLKLLLELVGGNPYLINLAFYGIYQNHLSIEKILREAPTMSGLYQDHLQPLLQAIKASPALENAFKKVINTVSKTNLDTLTCYQLENLGLITIKSDKIEPSCGLYRLFFQNQLY